jgi:nitroreductase
MAAVLLLRHERNPLMDLLDGIRQRRAIRDYTEAKVANSTINELLQAAVQAPSALNQQPWAFAVFTGKERLKSYSDRAKDNFLIHELPAFGMHERGNTLTDKNFNVFYNAGTLIVICAKPGTLNPEEDCSLAAQTLMLAAHAMGLGTCPIGIVRPWLQLPEIKAELGIPPDYHAVFPLILGYPASQPPPVPRLAPEIVHWK